MNYLTGQPEQEAIGWLKEAAKVAEKALCLRAKCGAVIVKDHEIIGSGYNAPPLDEVKNRRCLDEYQLPPKLKYDRTCCLHAEWRAIMEALKNHAERLPGAKLYFTRVDESGQIIKSGQPYCTVCSRLALDSGLEKFILWHEAGVGEYPTDEYNQLSYQTCNISPS